MHECNICFNYKYCDQCNFGHFICTNCKQNLNTGRCIICNPYVKDATNNRLEIYNIWDILRSNYGYAAYIYIIYFIEK